MTKSKKQFLAALLVLALAGLFCAVMATKEAHAQEQPKVLAHENTCDQFSTTVTDLTPGDSVRFQLGHDLVKTVPEVSEQDTVATFQSGKFPAGDWGFSVRVNDQEIFNEIVTVKPCAGARTLEVTASDCNTVTVLGNGWAQTEATVEVAIPPAEGGESREDLLVIKQVQPSPEGVFHTTLDWPSTPPDGSYAAVVLIDNIQQDPQSEGFQINCSGQPTGELPFTGVSSVSMLAAVTAALVVIIGLLLIQRPRP